MLQPLHDYVLLKKVEEEKTTASGILLSSAKEKSKLAQVVALGDEVKEKAYDLGDQVLYKEFATTNIQYENVEYMLIKDEDIIAVKK